jgi:hypothetical protein
MHLVSSLLFSTSILNCNTPIQHRTELIRAELDQTLEAGAFSPSVLGVVHINDISDHVAIWAGHCLMYLDIRICAKLAELSSLQGGHIVSTVMSANLMLIHSKQTKCFFHIKRRNGLPLWLGGLSGHPSIFPSCQTQLFTFVTFVPIYSGLFQARSLFVESYHLLHCPSQLVIWAGGKLE